MKFSLCAGIFGIVALFATVGCTGSGGGGILDRPGGTISLTEAATGKSVDGTSAANPYLVSDLRFTIDATESHFAGPYTVTIVAETNVPTPANGGFVYPFSFNVPCFVVSQNATLTTAQVPISFVGSNANGQLENYPTGSAPAGATGDPCHSGELETATIADTDGHSVNFYYEQYP